MAGALITGDTVRPGDGPRRSLASGHPRATALRARSGAAWPPRRAAP